MTRARMWIGSVVLLVAYLVGCGGEQPPAEDPVVIQAGDRELTLADVVSEAERVRGEGWWERVSHEDRMEFVNLLANKEVLVLNAMDQFDGEFTDRSQLIWNRWYEKQAQARFIQVQRASIDVPESVYDSVAALMQEERYLVQVVCDDESTARDIYAGVQAGGDFDAIATDFEQRMPERVHFVTVGWVVQPRLAAPIAEALFALDEPGKISEPFETLRYGWHIVRYDSLRTTGYTADAPEVKGITDPVYIGNEMRKFADDIQDRCDLSYHFENVDPIARAFAAMYDSMNAGRATSAALDWQALHPPLHRFSPEEKALPLVDYAGGTLTIGDFVETLEHIDIDYWPTMTDSAVLTVKIKGRMDRWCRMREIEKSDLDQDPDFQRAQRLKRDELFLEQFEQANIEMFNREVSEEQVRAYWDEHQDRYVSRDLVGYGFLRIPAGNEDLAWRTYDQIQRGADFGRAATNALKTNKFVVYEAQLDPTWGPPYEEITDLALNYAPQEDGTPFITEPLALPGGDFVILRVYFRQAPNTLDFESARSFVTRDLQRELIERDVMAMIDELKARYNLQIHEELVP